MKSVGAVERHPDGLPFVFEAEIAPTAGFGHAKQGIALARIRTRAVGAVQPTLHQFELLAEIGIICHEDKPALLIEAVFRSPPIMLAADVSAVGHAATNEAGRSQPLEPEWNPNGYLYNAAQPIPVVISKTRRSPTVAAQETSQPEPDGYKAVCFACHDDHMMRQQRLTRAQWDREVTKMTGWGAPVKPEQRDGLLDYLSAVYKP